MATPVAAAAPPEAELEEEWLPAGFPVDGGLDGPAPDGGSGGDAASGAAGEPAISGPTSRSVAPGPSDGEATQPAEEVQTGTSAPGAASAAAHVGRTLMAVALAAAGDMLQ